jgi:superfamily II DNA or RNA helicase
MLLIQRDRNLLELGCLDGSPLPPALLTAIAQEFTYTQKRFLRGADRYGVDGHVQNVAIERRQLFDLPGNRARFVAGHYSRLLRLVQKFGMPVSFQDITEPAYLRPHVYVPDWAACQRFGFRPRQRDMLEAIANNPGGIISGPPGFGKTFSFEVLSHLFPQARIHVIVRPVSVARRIVRQVSRSTMNVGLVGDGSQRFGEFFTVITAGSLHHSEGNADFVFGDEAHQLVTDETCKYLARYRDARIFMLTATPDGRFDNLDQRLEMIAGPKIFELTYPEAVSLGLCVPIHVRWLPVSLSSNPAGGRTGVPRERWGIWRNLERNRIIAADVARYPADHQNLILCSKIEHAIMLRRELPDFTLCYGNLEGSKLDRYVASGLLPADYKPLKPQDRAQLEARFAAGELRKVIATSVWATGVDFESLQTVHRVDAVTSAIMAYQAPGRVSRIHQQSGKIAGEVVDCLDLWSEHYYNVARNKRGYYASYGWSQSGWPAQC